MTDYERYVNFKKNNPIPVSIVNGEEIKNQRDKAWDAQQEEIDKLRFRIDELESRQQELS